MADGPEPAKLAGPILSAAEAKRRFFIYLVIKLAGLGALFAGVLLSRGGFTPVGGIALLVGAISLFVRPRMLGLTTRPEK